MAKHNTGEAVLAQTALSRPHADRVAEIAHIQLGESEAERLWRDASRHRRELLRRLGRDVGQRVAVLDYLTNIHPHHGDVAVIDAAALGAIERLVMSDALTGLYDRGYFEHALKREVDRCRRSGASLSLLLLDLDEFKEINDAYGSRVGDRVLRTLGDLIRKDVRAADLPCRVRGDELGIILPDEQQSDARLVAERFRKDVESWFEANPVCGQFLEVTVSGGIATVPLDASGPEHLFIKAERALCQAKRAGSNRIVTAADLVDPPTPAAA
jgi:diguanylate cyclase (GGDEF)-like protein